jgi:hypothetical protein
MGIEELEHNIERMAAAIEYYKELLARGAEERDIELKRDFTKEQILKFTLATKKTLSDMEDSL